MYDPNKITMYKQVFDFVRIEEGVKMVNSFMDNPYKIISNSALKTSYLVRVTIIENKLKSELKRSLKSSKKGFVSEFSVSSRPGSSLENKKKGNSEKYRIPPTGAENYQVPFL